MCRKLDLRNVRIYANTAKDIKDAINLIGEEVYLSDWADFNPHTKDKLISVICTEDVNCPFFRKAGSQSKCGYRYFILAKDAKFVEEKKLRPFESVEEFSKATGCKQVGDIITIKRKENITDNIEDSVYPTEHTLLFTGYCTYQNEILDICLGHKSYTFEELKNDFLYFKDGKWCPFGVEE